LKINGINFIVRNKIPMSLSFFLVPANQSLIVSFPSSVEYQEWCEKFYLLLSTKAPNSQPIVKVIIIRNFFLFNQ
jgi:hypothetical protein